MLAGRTTTSTVHTLFTSADISGRSNKRKCRIQPRQSACQRCQAHHLRCSFDVVSLAELYYRERGAEDLVSNADSQASPKPSSAPSQLTLHSPVDNAIQQGNQLPNSWESGPDHVRSMVKSYFTVIHDKHHSLFHQPTFEQHLDAGLIPEIILLAIVSLGAR
jgi:hypothetical protein